MVIFYEMFIYLYVYHILVIDMNAKEVSKEEAKGADVPRSAQADSGQGQYKSSEARYLVEVLKEIKQKYKNSKIYMVMASRDSDIEKGAFLVVTSDDILIFGTKLYDEPFFSAWTDDINEFEMDSDISLFVKEIEGKVIEKIYRDIVVIEVR